jgi:acetylornithine/LysW-gamma-L-lysine aminotransferase
MPLVPAFKHVPFNNLAKLQKAINENTAAVILEIVQGEGGVHPATKEFLQGAQHLCREHDCLLILDEVQTGFGRTGKMFALEHFNLEPDILCLAKSIASGIPMGATLIGNRVKQLTPGIHGSTFGGNPIAISAAMATLKVLQEEKLEKRAEALGKYLIDELKKLESPPIREVRGLGLMVGIELRQKATPYIKKLAEHGVLVLSAGMTVIRLLPPLVITQEQLSIVVEKIDFVLNT